MVLFDEDPVTLISETTNQFHIAPDKESLSRLSSSLAALAVNRTARLEQEQGSLKSLSRKLHAIRSQHEYEQGRRDTGRHAGEILALDGEKFRIAKAVNEVEVEGERLASELIGLRRQLEVLKSEGVEGGRRARSKEDDQAV
ncbi:hypothetical protein AMS68_006864 [Peltaster fructicola]|uniref:Kinetochore protein Spc24 n=1 Tax=Peltaster fructicola TaxID=286661 RepID=A0A6H0Y2W7_9PEZI|nr:hypothetical protein AMS68_006864 [Peltaster fructicola]